MLIPNLRHVVGLSFLLLPVLGSAQSPSPPILLRWRELAPFSLGTEDSAALATVPDLRPTQWPVERADLTLSGHQLFFLRGKIGSGTGFGYSAAYLFARPTPSVLWLTLTREYVADGDFLPDGWHPFELNTCLFATPDSIGYAVVVHPPNATATQALTSDTLVRPAAWYRWNATRSGLVPGGLVSRELTEQCRASIWP